MSRKRHKCSRRNCTGDSVRGLSESNAMCPYHWAEYNWGKEWAAKCHPDHPEAKAARAAIAKAEGTP